MTGAGDSGDAEVILGVFDRRGAAADIGTDTEADARDGVPAEVIRFAPYLLARRRRAVAPPAHPA